MLLIKGNRNIINGCDAYVKNGRMSLILRITLTCNQWASIHTFTSRIPGAVTHIGDIEKVIPCSLLTIIARA
jgi:hypothetical protein